MATVLLPAGINTTPSADFTLTAPTLVVMTGATHALGASIHIELKKANNTYQPVTTLQGGTPGASGVLAAGTYRALRGQTGISLGLEKA